MTLLLGIDTGGTYTDAVILRDEKDVIASAKSLTTRHDLAIGIGAAVKDVLFQSGIEPSEISMASLSTTLATNALVEGQGERVGLVDEQTSAHGLGYGFNYVGCTVADVLALELQSVLFDEVVLREHAIGMHPLRNQACKCRFASARISASDWDAAFKMRGAEPWTMP